MSSGPSVHKSKKRKSIVPTEDFLKADLDWFIEKYSAESDGNPASTALPPKDHPPPPAPIQNDLVDAPPQNDVMPSSTDVIPPSLKRRRSPPLSAESRETAPATPAKLPPTPSESPISEKLPTPLPKRKKVKKVSLAELKKDLNAAEDKPPAPLPPSPTLPEASTVTETTPSTTENDPATGDSAILATVLEDTSSFTRSPDAMNVSTEPNDTNAEPIDVSVESIDAVLGDKIEIEEQSSKIKEPAGEPLTDVSTAQPPESVSSEATMKTTTSTDTVVDDARENTPGPRMKSTTPPPAVTSDSCLSNGDRMAPTTSEPPSQPSQPEPADEDLISEAEDENMTDDDASPFVGRCIRLLVVHEGRAKCTPHNEPTKLTFTLSEEEVAQITRWNSRESTKEVMTDSMCVSLVKFTMENFVKALDDDIDGEIDITQCGHPVPWTAQPSGYPDWFVLHPDESSGGKKREITISPPFQWTNRDHIIDIGARGLLASPAENVLHLYQYNDLSRLFFAFILHHPTDAQLRELARSRRSKRKWEATLAGLGRFTVPAISIPGPPRPPSHVISAFPLVIAC
ncbi:uncharacterized protein BXZ73DRAFT_73320 [Epithele typhae]|uniref:uncharacterized protein n=1 Tax=Epithele typhae TaxID=378194 RepID=UPI002007ACB8|nr:uncharacterized protein BXZ73DRAFT_73320 [Epithele typhae]KAH9945119.1 hypothetical protein BXZ73DRAFT_73320 [Epithele typhae]